MFCSQKCIKEANQKFHHAECKQIDQKLTVCDGTMLEPDEADPSSIERIFCELFSIAGSIESLRTLKKSEAESTQKLDLSTNQKRLKMLKTFKAKMEERELNFLTKLGEMEIENSSINSKTDRKFLLDFAIKIVFIRYHNGFTFCHDKELHGGGLLPFGSFFNHSCDPNVGYCFVDGNFVFVVLKPIGKGEQLFVSYER
jgi:hypothetical protein